MNTIVGITQNGEHLRFERWLYEAWIRGNVRDPLLLACLNRCHTFYNP